MGMNRFEGEIRGFHAWRVQGGRMISPGGAAFMMELLLIFDAYQWPEVLEVPTELLALRLNVSKNTTINYRNELVGLGAISFDSSAGGKPGGYRVDSFVDPELVKKEDVKASPGLAGIMCVAEVLGVYWNDYAERKISKLVRQFGEKKVISGMLDFFNKKGSVNLDELTRNAYFSGKFGQEVGRRAGQEGATDFNAGAIRAADFDEGAASLGE